jgi:hypothetical protein
MMRTWGNSDHVPRSRTVAGRVATSGTRAPDHAQQHHELVTIRSKSMVACCPSKKSMS